MGHNLKGWVRSRLMWDRIMYFHSALLDYTEWWFYQICMYQMFTRFARQHILSTARLHSKYGQVIKLTTECMHYGENED
jgi:hypothetical protein